VTQNPVPEVIADRNDPCCGFCRAPASEVGKLIEGERINICDRCVVLAIELIFHRASGRRPRAPRQPLESWTCSFCYRVRDQANVLVRTDHACICDLCLRNIVKAVAENLRSGGRASPVLELFGSAGPPAA